MSTDVEHTAEKERIIKSYEKSVDKEIYDFVIDVENGREVLPLTVGFVSDKMALKIFELTGLTVLGNRIVLGADDVRHIIKRHGKAGKADHSMEDINDIARLSYVLSNYDVIEWDGGVSNHYKTKDGKRAPQITIKKRINGTYYVIEVVSDSSKNRNVVSTIYLKNADE